MSTSRECSVPPRELGAGTIWWKFQFNISTIKSIGKI
jgi:hypothetical protein